VQEYVLIVKWLIAKGNNLSLKVLPGTYTKYTCGTAFTFN